MSETTKLVAEVRIEPVKLDELEELASLAARSFSDAFGHTMEDEDLHQTLKENRSVEYFAEAIEESSILVAKQEGKIVGYVQFGSVKIPEVEAGEDDRELGRLYIETALQGQGIGRQLMDAALAAPEMAAAPNVYLQVWDKNTKAIPLYEKYGFERVGFTEFELAGKPAQDLIMVRRQHLQGAA